MAVQFIRKVRGRQPTQLIGIAKTPLTRGLLFAAPSFLPDSISGKPPTISGGYQKSGGSKGLCAKAPATQISGALSWPVAINIAADQDYSWVVFARRSDNTDNIHTHAISYDDGNTLAIRDGNFTAMLDNNSTTIEFSGKEAGLYMGQRIGNTLYAFAPDGTYSSGITGTRAQVITKIMCGRDGGLNNLINTETYMMAFWGRALSVSEFKSLSANPWQIFEPEVIPLFFSTVTAQYARPTSDVSAGTWTASSGSDLYAMLDETAASDADYITTTGTSTCEVALGTMSDPASSSGHIVRYRIAADSGGITVRLRQGTTTIATWAHASAPTSLTTYEQTLTGGEADSITDYSALRLQFEAT